MRPRRTPFTDCVFRLPGGTEDNDLWVARDTSEEGAPILRSTWQPSKKEREAIAAGENIELIIWDSSHPPVAVATTAVPLGAGKTDV